MTTDRTCEGFVTGSHADRHTNQRCSVSRRTIRSTKACKYGKSERPFTRSGMALVLQCFFSVASRRCRRLKCGPSPEGDFRHRKEAVMIRRILWLVLFLLTLAVFSTSAQTVYMQDTPADTGAEPNPDTGPMWVSDDIWVRTSPDPGYQPYPFLESSPPWTPLPNQNPEYRDPKYSVPNYIYVRVH